MKCFDFVFVYEVKNRELENILLLRCELEKRGYSVCFVETWDQVFHLTKPISAKVVVTFQLYNRGSIRFLESFVKNCNKIINLQWEQVFTNGDVKANNQGLHNSYGVSGTAIYGVHICWGRITHDRLVKNYGVDDRNAPVVGSIAMDFLRPEFISYYQDRNALLKRYNINPRNKLVLFISSFNYSGLPKEVLESSMFQNQGFNVNEFARVSLSSQDGILNWFEIEIEKNPDITVVYRPHPAENNNERLKHMSEKNGNFYVISDYSVKQWIIIADKIFSWYSTSVVEAYMAHKGCSILRPVEVPYDSELELYNNAKLITSFEEFDRNYTEEVGCPLDIDLLNAYYDFDFNKPTYRKVADVCEEVLNDDSYQIQEMKNENMNSFAMAAHNVKKFFVYRVICNKVFYSFLRMITKSKKNRSNKIIDSFDVCMYNKKMYQNNHTSKKDLDMLYEKIKKLIFVK